MVLEAVNDAYVPEVYVPLITDIKLAYTGIVHGTLLTSTGVLIKIFDYATGTTSGIAYLTADAGKYYLELGTIAMKEGVKHLAIVTGVTLIAYEVGVKALYFGRPS